MVSKAMWTFSVGLDILGSLEARTSQEGPRPNTQACTPGMALASGPLLGLWTLSVTGASWGCPQPELNSELRAGSGCSC